MASLQSVIEIIFSGTDDLSAAARSAAGAVSSFGEATTTVAKPLADLANAALLTEGAVIAMAGALIAKGVDAAGKFSDSFAFTTTLIDDTGQSVDNFRQDILNYAQGSTQSIDSINTALQSAIGQGIEYSDSIKLLAIAEKLAVAQGGELNETTQLLVGTLNGYGLKVTDAAKLSDQFSVTIRDGKISISELSVGLSQITPLAVTLGVGVDQVGSALATLTAQGIPGAQAMTLLKGVMSGIISPTDQAKEAASELGINFTAAGLASKGLGGFLAEIIQKAGGSSEKISQLFTDTEPLIGALSLGGIGAEKFAKELEEMAAATGATDTAFNKMAGNIGLSTQRIRNAIDIAFINFGDPLLDEVGSLSKGVAGIFNELGDSFKDGGALRPISAALEDFISSLSETLATIGRNLPDALEGLDFSRLLESFGGLGEAVRELFDVFSGGLDLTTTEGLRDAIQKIVDSGALLTNVVTGIVNAFRPLADAAGRSVEEFQKLDSASAIDFGKFIGSAKLLIDAGVLLGGTLIAIGEAGLSVGKVFDVVFGGIGAAVNVVQVAFNNIVIAILEVNKKILEAKILNESSPWGSPEKLKEFQAQLAETDKSLENWNASLERNNQEGIAAYKRAMGEGSDATNKLGADLDASKQSLDKFRVGAKDVNGELQDWSTGLTQANQGVTENRALILSSNSAMMDWSDGIRTSKKSVIEWSDSIKGIPEIPLPDGVQISLAFQEAGKGTGIYQTALEGLSTSYSQVGTATVKATGAFKSIDTSATEAAKKIDETTKKAQEYQLKLEEISSNERIKTIEAVIKLNVAQLETDMERVKAAFASIDNTVSSTGDLLGGLFGNLSDADFHARSLIENQIQLENKRRQDALDLQRKLAEAEIERINAQTAALDRGLSMIEIDGKGLQPHLEAFMFEILKQIRVKLTGSYQDFLLALAAPA